LIRREEDRAQARLARAQDVAKHILADEDGFRRRRIERVLRDLVNAAIRLAVPEGAAPDITTVRE
jgi:hypothetical protein